MTRHVCFFSSMLIPADLTSLKMLQDVFSVWNISTNEMHGCLFSVLQDIFQHFSPFCLRTTNPYLTAKASWVLEACWFRLSLSYGCKSTNKKGWMCVQWYEMWNKTTTIHPHWQLMVKSCIVPLPLYTVRLSKISLRTQNRSLTWKRKSQ